MAGDNFLLDKNRLGLFGVTGSGSDLPALSVVLLLMSAVWLVIMSAQQSQILIMTQTLYTICICKHGHDA